MNNIVIPSFFVICFGWIIGLWFVVLGLISAVAWGLMGGKDNREKFKLVFDCMTSVFRKLSDQTSCRKDDKTGTANYYSGSQKTTEWNKPTDTTIQPAPKRQTERNKNPSHSNQMRCETCGKQLFVTQPFTYHREFYKFWCLRCYGQRG